MTNQTERMTFAEAVAALAAAQKTSAGVPAYLRYINRPLGRRAAALAYRLGLSPNNVTVLSGLTSLASMVVLVTVPPSWATGLIVAAGMVVGYALDSADGQLARLTRGGSLTGEWLDHVIDAARMPAVHLCVAIALFRFGNIDSAYLLIPLGYSLVVTVTFFSVTLVGQMRARVGVEQHVRRDGAETSASWLRSLATLPVDFGAVCLVFILWGEPIVFMIAYITLFVINFLHMALSVIRKYRELLNAKE